ncbi:uncharacterized protein LOC121383145 [Gigantopelta aegis]|uniref:uncharacterized protein LOC121383145 n=1 Tax=Gigantopelta aegis TaxID=1735272 RepID=UPI001B88ADC0|nr:uncharacterized protein LOC121383145 [Gigantopelta aegis]
MDSLLCLFVHLALLSTSFGSQITFYGETGETQQCPLDKPCAILVQEYNRNGTMKQEYWTDLCTCGDGAMCSVDWGVDPDKTIRQYLKTNIRDMVLEMKFCRRVQPLAVCSPNQMALSLKGYSLIPRQLNSINCRCPGNAPLHLQKVWYERYMERHQNFVCSIPTCDVPTVNHRVPCLLAFEQLNPRHHETTFVCECPEPFRCILPPSSTRNEITPGFCQRVSY